MIASAIIPGRDLKKDVEFVDALPCRASRAPDGRAGAAATSFATICAAAWRMLVRLALPESSAATGNGTSAMMTTIQTNRILRLHDRAIQTLIEILRIRPVLSDYSTRADRRCADWRRSISTTVPTAG